MRDSTPARCGYLEAVHAIAIIGGLTLDRIFGDPQRYHPVAYFGTAVTKAEKVLYRDSKAAGAALVAVTTLPVVMATHAVYRKAPTITTAVALWAALGGRTLEETGRKLAQDLDNNDLDSARTWIPWLCSRDPSLLDEAGMARAAVESIAENTSDAAIAPIVWAAIAGAPGVVLHRCVNTLDAMVGYKSERYRNFGWAAAKLDDVLAYLPARLTAVTHVVLAKDKQAAIAAWKHDAPQHPSPNAGPVEATAAAALGVQLGGETHYSYGVEMRPTLGTGPRPTARTIREAVQLAQRTQLIMGAVAVGLRSLVFRGGNKI
ncbi:adenosylcobinamide-phosphate synthase CbiB [Corynebacterium hindlerae]|uniref:adenosylcobinamide-phosphate synthase CbiB n=1 Tax=Corynebacterium hindlerae TaxID=699041 RepID=UPI003AAA2CC3